MPPIEIVVPVAPSRTVEAPLASRLARRDGLRLGLLDNRKANAAALLDGVAAALADSGLAFERVGAVKDATAAAPEAAMAHLKTCDAVVLAIAD